MKNLLVVWFVCITTIGEVWAQENRYDVIFSYGFYNAPNLDRIKAKGFYSADFEYHLSKKWAFSSGFMRGSFAYLDTIRTGVFPEPKDGPTATNGEGYESHLYLSVAYSIVNQGRLTLQAGTGAGMYTRTLKYPYRGPSSTDDRIFISEESFTKFELPLKVNAYYLIGNRIGLGIRAGAFLLPSGSIVGMHISPQLRLRL